MVVLFVLFCGCCVFVGCICFVVFDYVCCVRVSVSSLLLLIVLLLGCVVLCLLYVCCLFVVFVCLFLC